MATVSEFPSMGAALFFGLTATTLITQGTPEIEYANPNETMIETGFKTAPVPAPFVLYAAWGEPVTLRDAVLVEVRPRDLPELAVREVVPAKPPRDLPTPDLTDAVIALAAVAPRTLGQPGAVDAVSPAHSSPLRLAAHGKTPLTLPEPTGFKAPAAMTAPDAPPEAARVEFSFMPPAPRLDPFAAPEGKAPQDSLKRGSTPYPRLAVVDRPVSTPEPPAPFTPPQVNVVAVNKVEPATRPNLRARNNAPIPVRTSRALDENPPAQPLPEAQRKPRPARVTGDFVFMRAAPASNAAPLGQFDAGARALIFEERGKWRRVEISGTVGWMFGSFLSPSSLE